jgi:carbon monoxide dehydrogenase subunit G
MEHEAFVPVPAASIRRALADPARVARSVPGLQQQPAPADAPPEEIGGRLRVRIGGSTITYRGTLRISPRGDKRFVVEAEGVEARGSGTVKLSLDIAAEPAEGGTLLAFSGTLQAGGRLAEFADETATAAAHRLLDRFVTALAEEEEPEHEAPRPLEDAADAADAVDAEDAADAEDPADPEIPEDVTELPEGVTVPESAAELDELDVLEPGEDEGEEPPAEAAHARRTMIGRSAEEVDHAPPRGRYAPVPPPDTTARSEALRWAAPAAAALIASAVVVGRVLRRRR